MASPPLAEAAQQCIDHLRQQIALANSLSGQQKLNRIFLLGAVQELQTHRRELEKWKNAINVFQPGDDLKGYHAAIRDATDACSLIETHVNTIESTLQNAQASKSLSDKENCTANNGIEYALDHIKTNIVTLNQWSSLFHQGSLRNDIALFVKKEDRLKDFFEGEIRKIPRHVRRLSFSLHQRQFETQFGELLWLWRHLPIGSQGLKGEVPGDGVIIGKDQVDRARSVLRRFRDAWITANENTDAAPTDRDKLLILEKMPKIAMVLWMARKHHLFNIFLENEIDDRDMDINPYDQKVRDCLSNDADYICAQYSRAREREWEDGDHLKLSPSEPLPLQRETVYKDTPSITFVDKVRDSWHPEKEYARKVLLVPEQFKIELINLKDICHEDHGHHLVKYVKTYERGEELGVLLSPVASHNLNDLLLTCSRKPVERRQNRPALIRAFGCLAYSMCYLHNFKRFRHRDVKPHNILCLRKTGQEGEFMWSDFGLAYKFGQGVSGTVDQGFRATPQYEAPEIGKPNSIHGRSADIFSLGCVFLEIINILSLGDKETHDRIPIRETGHYKAKIRSLDQWSERKVSELRRSGERTLRKILEISRGMIKEEPRHRLKIGEVALKLAELKPSGQNTPHPFCTHCTERRAKDRSKSPHHKEIFVHKKENWPKC